MIGLEYIRKLNSDTVDSLAEKLHVTKGLISQWENQKSPIPNKRLEELSKLYNVSQEYFSRELTKLEQLHIEYDKVSDEYDATVNEYELPVDFDENGIPRGFVTQTCGDNGILAYMRILETDIEIEETLQEVRDIIDENCSKYHEPFGMDSIVDTREKNINLIRKFVSLMKDNDVMFLAYILRAVELSGEDGDAWGEIPKFDKNGLTGKVLAVIKEWKEAEQKRREAEYQEYKELFGIDNDE